MNKKNKKKSNKQCKEKVCWHNVTAYTKNRYWPKKTKTFVCYHNTKSTYPIIFFNIYPFFGERYQQFCNDPKFCSIKIFYRLIFINTSISIKTKLPSLPFCDCLRLLFQKSFLTVISKSVQPGEFEICLYGNPQQPLFQSKNWVRHIHVGHTCKTVDTL